MKIILVCLMIMTIQDDAFNSFLNKEKKQSKILVKAICDQKPLQNCVISDGFTCAITDKKGMAEISKNEKSSFVFISIPSGYKLAKNEKFYKEILSDEKEYIFELEKIEIKDSFKFLAIGDPQILDGEDFKRFQSESLPFIKEYGEKIEAEFAVVLGDVSYDDLSIFEKYLNAIKNISFPIFHLPGNHDLDSKQKENTEAKKLYLKHFGPAYYSFNFASFHFVVLDNVYWDGKDYCGYITEEQIEWFRQDISAFSEMKNFIIIMHIPPESDFAERLNIAAKEKFYVKNIDSIYKILENKNFYIIAGHLHENYLKKNKNYELYCVASIGGAWWTSDICCDGSPNGVGVFEVNDNKLNYRFVGNGLDENERLFYYLQKNGKDSIEALLNCWDIMEDVNVIGIDDNGNKIFFERFAGKDKKAEILYSDASNYKHKWIKPYLTHHLYKTKISNKTKSLKIFYECNKSRVFVKEINFEN